MFAAYVRKNLEENFSVADTCLECMVLEIEIVMWSVEINL